MKEPTTGETIEKSSSAPLSLDRAVSPPPFNPRRRLLHKANTDTVLQSPSTTKSDAAKVEAGEVEIDDHVSFFSTKLLGATLPPVDGQPRLSHTDWLVLYQRNLNNRGHHFVVHQHDHPVAGTHYDLRIQCNATSSISFALPYGVPGDPNSRKLNRFAIETRVHNLWNHLIETASYETGTMLLWDTGEYEVLPYDSSGKTSSADDATASEGSDTDTDSGFSTRKGADSEPQKLHRAFQNRKIKLRLNGTRLPKNYTVSLRLLEDNNRVAQPNAPSFKRRRTNNTNDAIALPTTRKHSRAEDVETSSDSSRASSPTPTPWNDAPNEPASPPASSEISSRTPSPNGTSFDSLDHELRRKKPSPKLKRSVSSLLRTASPPPPRRSSSVTQFQTQAQPQQYMKTTYSQSSTQTSIQAQPQLLPEPQRPSQHARTTSSPGITPTPTPSTTKPTPRSNHLDDSTLETAEDATIRATNTYPGAHNSINSIHQRKWFLSLDRAACGFKPTSEFAFGRRIWERPRLLKSSGLRGDGGGGNGMGEAGLGGFKSFYVLGRDVERSVLTGRLGAEVARDEGLVGFKGRGGWRGITD